MHRLVLSWIVCGVLFIPAWSDLPPTLGATAISTRVEGNDFLFIDFAENPNLTLSQRGSLLNACRAAVEKQKPAAALKVDYPLPGSLFPPDMVPPTFLFHDSAGMARIWLVVVSQEGEPNRLYVLTDGRQPQGEIDPRCGTHDDEYQRPEYQVTAKCWTPALEIWSILTRQPEKEIAVSICGLPELAGGDSSGSLSLLSQGSVTLRISKDPVGAPIFYRDVPLMPTANEKGIIKPLADGAMPLVEWRLRDLTKPSSRVVLKNLPTCTNCHSFSQDGKVLGMDMDGPSGDKGSYALAQVQPYMVISKDKVFSWSAFDRQKETFGLFSRVSPDGRCVVSSVNESLFVTNYMDFRFLQTFYPTRGILAFYDRTTGKIAPLAGADDPEYVHCNAVWTPNGRQLIFLRAKATDNIVRGPRPVKANDPNEIQIKYDLCMIPFNKGRGGTAEPIPGASNNGKSNSFPKISPDGRWLVWVQAANGLLMRPDSELYIMPLSGGKPRRMSCNLSPMNSWHSFSPNSRWMVFSSKANAPYTEMFLTHIDDQGNDSPAILIPNSTPSNRAVNLPEFVNIKPDELISIDAPAVDYRRHLDRGLELIRTRNLPEAFKELKTVEEMNPNIPDALAALGYCYREMGDIDTAVSYFQKTLALDPRNWSARNMYGIILFRQGKHEEALSQFQAAIDIYPINSLSLANSLTNMGAVYFTRGQTEKAKEYFEKAVQANPQYAEAHFNLGLLKARQEKFAEALGHYEKCLETAPDNGGALGNLAWLYATCPEDGVRNGRRALELARELERLTSKPSPQLYDIVAAAYAECGQFAQAVEMAEKALQLTPSSNPGTDRRRRLVDLYKSGKAYHQQER